MPTNSISVIYEFWVASFCGAATKTYLDWKAQRQRLAVMLCALTANSTFAVVVGPHMAELFITTLPQWSNFGKAVAYLSGAIAINIMSALLSISWKEIILAKLRVKK